MTGPNQDRFTKFKHRDDLEMSVLSDWRYSQGYVTAHNPDWQCVGGRNGKSCFEDLWNQLDTVYAHVSLLYKVHYSGVFDFGLDAY